MPFEKQVPDEKILAQFEREDIDRPVYTYSEVAEGVDEVTAEAVRQRLKQMEGEKVESMKIGSLRLWHKSDVTVFGDESQSQDELADGLGALANKHLPAEQISFLSSQFALLNGILGAFSALLGVSAWLGVVPGGNILAAAALTAACFFVRDFILGKSADTQFEDDADPSAEWKDVKNALFGGKK